MLHGYTGIGSPKQEFFGNEIVRGSKVVSVSRHVHRVQIRREIHIFPVECHMADFGYEGPATVGDDQLEAWEIQGQPIDDEGAVVRQIWGDIPPEGQEYGDAVLLAQFVDRVNPLIIGIERRGTEARLQQDAPAGPLEGEMFRFPQGFLTIKRIDTRNPDKPAGV